MGVLKAEIELMEKIIENCEKRNLEFDVFEAKKDMLDVEINVKYLFVLENRNTSCNRRAGH